MSKEVRRDLDGKIIKPQICDLCGRERGDHQARSLHCPLGRKRDRFAVFHREQTYKERG